MFKKIEYPIEQLSLGLVGKPEDGARSIMLLPRLHGEFSLLVYPKSFLYKEYIQRFDFFNPPENTKPFRFRVNIKKKFSTIKDWEWRLVKHPIQKRLDGYDGPKDSDLVFLSFPEITGTFKLHKRTSGSVHKILLWSCNQPFVTENEKLRVNALTGQIFKWYRAQVEEFSPDAIWGLGDTAYSDGTEASNFIDSFYDHPAWLERPEGREALQRLYREMYIYHWSFKDFQEIMRNYPHYCIWDDHEIRDGWGSENQDFQNGNRHIYPIAKQAGNEFILENGPRVRSPEYFPESDAHQAYVEGSIASFIFDGRSSRRYHSQKGHVLSEEQFQDFERFCEQIATREPEVKYLVMGCGVPFINLKDYVELLAEAPKALTDLLAGIRDDLRDSWTSPGNKAGLKRLLNIIKQLEKKRPDIYIVNVSGDIHVASAFAFQPPGFSKAMYQVTSSALTNREHPPKLIAPMIYQDDMVYSDSLGLVNRLWNEVTNPNILLIEPKDGILHFRLKVFDLDHDLDKKRTLSSDKDLNLSVGIHDYGLSYATKNI